MCTLRTVKKKNKPCSERNGFREGIGQGVDQKLKMGPITEKTTVWWKRAEKGGVQKGDETNARNNMGSMPERKGRGPPPPAISS